MRKLNFKIFLPSILTILLFILTIFLFIIPHFQQNIMNGKREMIKELTNSAWSILSKYENDERIGILTQAEAQKTAVSRIQYLRYGEENKDYFWITDLYPVMIIHPYRSDLNGQDLTNFSDPHGKKLFVEFVKTVKNSGQGYVDYMWQWKDDSLHIVPKLSYVKIFEPWGWVIGTGIYIEDVNREIKALTKKLIWISVGISFLISFLLFYISKQSIKIEFKRLEAENKLHESKEKYRTLVEAATDGLILLSDGKISLSNNLFSKMIGYDPPELINHSLNDIISQNNTKESIERFSKNIIIEGQYEINLNKKNGDIIQVLITASTVNLYENTVNILIVKDITIDKKTNSSEIDFEKLILSMEVGFFKARLDGKGRFIFANEQAIRMLGSANLPELLERNIIDLLLNSEEIQSLRNELLEKGFMKNRIIKIRKNTNSHAILSATLTLSNHDQPDKIFCEGIIDDITLLEKDKTDTLELTTTLKSNNFLLERSVVDFITPFYTLDADSTIGDAVLALSKRKTDCLLITKNPKNHIGIITNSDIQRRLISLNLHLENPAYLIMSSPIIYLNEKHSVFEAISVCEEHRISHLAVKNDSGVITGIVRLGDILGIMKDSLDFFIASISAAETVDELRNCYLRLQRFIKPLIYSEISIKYITRITSSFSDAVTKRLIALAIQDLGQPPVRFSFIALGSEGRREETLLTDQDNAIVYEDAPKGQETSVNSYFMAMGEKVCNSLDQIGYSFCRGNIMAKNPKWCQPSSIWEDYFTDWITTPEPQNLLEATIFFDLRNIYGAQEQTDRLKTFIFDLIKANPGFLYHLAHNAYFTKVPHVSSVNIISDKTGDFLDLKNAVSLITMFARTYSLQNNIAATGTLERLETLGIRNIISEAAIKELTFGFNYLMKMRLENQALQSDNKLPMSNALNSKKLIDIEYSFLKKVISLLPVYQNKIKADFRLMT